MSDLREAVAVTTGRWRRHRRSTMLALAVVCLGMAVTAPTRAGATSSQHGGATLDGWGGVHPFGGAVVDTSGAPYWRGWDIARSLVVLPDGSGGWEMDGFGGIHAFGTAPAIGSPAIYWSGWDIARALVVTPDEAGGYVLDGYGGLHNFGTAAPLTQPTYWQGWDIARGLEIHYTAGVADGGWVLDGFGGIHAFGSAPGYASPAYFSGYDVWRNIHQASNGSVYIIGRYGAANGVAGSVSPYWSGYSDWGGWDILRDTVLLDPTNPTFVGEPISPSAMAAFTEAHSAVQGLAARPECGVPRWAPGTGKRIVISLACQELNAYQDGKVVIDTYVTTGKPILPTPPGHYSVLYKSHPFLMQSSWPYGTIGWYSPSWVQYVLWFRSDGYGIHDAWWRGTYGPGTNLNGSHGCVNVPMTPMVPLFWWADVGVPVDVY